MTAIQKRSILFLILASVLWSTGGLLIKWVDWNAPAIAGTRSAIAAVVMLAYLRKPPGKIKGDKLIGAMFYAATLICFVTANKLTTAANAILLQFTSPIWIALLSGWILKEKVHRYDWATIAVVFGGMTLFFVDSIGGGQLIGNGVAVMSGLFFAGLVVFMKKQNDGSPVEVTFYGNILTAIICLPFMLHGMPTGKGLIALIILGVFQIGVAYILYAEAVKHLSAIECILIPVIEPLLNPIWVMLGTGETPSMFAVLGGAIVMVAVIARSLYVNKLVNSRVNG